MQKTSGSSSPLSWSVLAVLGGAVVVSPAVPGCAPIKHQEAGDEWEVESIVVGDVLAAVGPQVVEPGLARFVSALGELEGALDDWGAAAETGSPTDASQQAAQVAWIDAMMVWQELELAQIGPAGSSLSTVGGEDLRDEIYSWPTVNPCRVDQELMYAVWDGAGWFEANLVNSYGMDALEHIVHGEADNTCPGQVDINADGSWDELSSDDLVQRRVAFGRALTIHVSDLAQDLADTWSADGGNLSGDLALTTSDSPYSSEQEALNAVYDALFYLDSSTKDRKIGLPMGLPDAGCSTGTCPEDSEHLVSQVSHRAIVANLVGFRALFTGGEGAGMDDLLIELGHEALTVELLAAVDNAISVADGLDMPLDDAVDTHPEKVQELYDSVKVVTDILKGDLVTVLALSIPDEFGGDND